MPTTSALSDLHHEVIGSGPPVLFISGATGDAGHFTRTAAALADEYTAIAYDRRGCSRSADRGGDEPMSIAADAADAAALLEELGIVPAVAFGTSGGGDILLELVARRPDVLAGAIVHEPALVTLTEQPLDERLARIAELGEADPRRAMEAFIRLHTDDATFEALDPQLRERMLGNGERFFAQELGAFLSYVPDVEGIRESGVALRVLTSVGGVPPLVDAAVRFAGRLGLEARSVEGHHAPYLQHPEAFAEQLRPILRELS